MSSKYKILDPFELNYLTLTTVGWIDIFTRQAYRDIIIDSLNYCIENKGLSVHGYVIMPSHLHLILSTQAPYELSDVMRDFKAYTGRTMIKYLQDEKKPESRRSWLLYLLSYFAFGRKKKQDYQIWQHDNHPIQLYSDEVIFQKLEYLHLNPVRAGFVELPSHWLYSSAGFYESGKGPLPVVLLKGKYDDI